MRSYARFRNNSHILEFSEGLLAKTVKLEKRVKFYRDYASVLMYRGKTKKALQIARDGLAYSKESGEPAIGLQHLANQLERSLNLNN